MPIWCGKHKMTASDIDSESATDGQVLTADGAGAAAWEDASGGGASFAFDGATFTPGELVAESGARTVDIELTLGGEPITSGTLQLLFTVTNADGDLDATFDVTTFAFRFYLWDGVQETVASLLCGIEAVDGHVTADAELYNESERDVVNYVHVFLPDGSVVTSDAITVPKPA